MADRQQYFSDLLKLLDEDASGNLYQTRLAWPDAREATDPLSPDHFLHWDKPLSEQSEAVRKLLPDFSSLDRPITSLQGRIRLPDGSFADSEAQLSQALSARGIPGIRYLDGGSRGAGAGSHNYVVFDDKLIDIVSRNGQPVGNLGKMVAPQDEALRVAQANAAKPEGLQGLLAGADNKPMKRDFRKEIADRFKAETGDDISLAGTKLAGLSVRRDMQAAGNAPKGSLSDIYTPEQIKMLSDWEDYGTRSSNYAYHGTDISSLDGIRQQGLLANPPTRRQDMSKKNKVYLSANQRTARRYADGYSGKGAVLRVKTKSLAGQLEPDHFEDAAYTYGDNIPPEMIEMKVGKNWVPLK